MTIIVGSISQKGGVGKSTIAQLVALEFTNLGWTSKIADFDISQGTTFEWRARRQENDITPDITVEQYSDVARALESADQYDLFVFDGAPHSSRTTLQIAVACDFVIIPTGLAVNDLRPSVLLAHDLAKHIDPRRISFALCRVGDSAHEIAQVRQHLGTTPYYVLDGELHEMTGYRRALDSGRVPTETRYPSLNKRALQLAQSIVDRITVLQNERAA